MKQEHFNAVVIFAPSSKEKAMASIERSTFLYINSVRHPKVWWTRRIVQFFRWIIPHRRKWPKPPPDELASVAESGLEQDRKYYSRWGLGLIRKGGKE